MKRALVTEFKFSAEHENKLKELGVELKYVPGDLNEDQLIKELQNCQIYIIGGSDKATKKVIESTNLDLIVFWGTGWEDYVDISGAKQKAIEVSNTPHSNAYTVAEHTVALILDAVKKITYLNNETKIGKWPRRETWNLQDKTIGIIGMGHIGSSVARIMHNGFGMKVIYFSRSERPEIDKELNANKVSLDTLVKESDIVTLHIPLTDETKNIISRKELLLMKETAVLINCSRADLVEPKSLKDALKDNKITSAAFDVYYTEPSPKQDEDNWGLLSLPDNKFIITPHTAYGSKDAIEKTNEMVIENIESYLKSGLPKYKVN